MGLVFCSPLISMNGTYETWTYATLSAPASTRSCLNASRKGVHSISPIVPPTSTMTMVFVVEFEKLIAYLVGDVRHYLHGAAVVLAFALVVYDCGVHAAAGNVAAAGPSCRL